MEFEELSRAKEYILTHNQQLRAKLVNKCELQLCSLSSFLLETLPDSWLQRMNFPSAMDSQDSAASIEPLEGSSSSIAHEAYQLWKLRLGEEIGLSDWFLLDQKLIDRFAEVTGDEQWIHTDVVRAKRESIYRGTIAHGFLILSLLPVLTKLDDTKSCFYKNTKMVVNCGLSNVEFLHPVKAGSHIRAHTKLRSLNLLKRHIELTNEVTVEIQNSRKIACSANVLIRLYY